MTERTTGGPAFPCKASEAAKKQTAIVGKILEDNAGMTLRDYFAAAALQGLCAGFSAQANDDWPRDDEPEGYEVAASHAYIMADAMLKERGK